MTHDEPFDDLFAPEDRTPGGEEPRECWQVLLVDDEPDIHAALKLSLQDMVMEGRRLELIDARSAADAREIMTRNPDIALVLLDVVMETGHAGLDLVRYIRTDLGNDMVQILLVTGQPGYAPQREVVTSYGINGYRLKSELTSDKIFVSVCTALRTYQAIRDLDRQRRQLESQASRLQDQQEQLLRNEEEIQQQNEDLLATEERLRQQIAEYETEHTVRTKTELALRESEEWQRSILMSAMDGFLLVDSTGRVLEANSTYCRMSGYSEQELSGMHIADLDAMDTPEAVYQRIQKLLRTGEDRFESRHRCKDGTVYDVEVSIQYREGGGGRFITFLRDITERCQLDRVHRFLAEVCSGTGSDDQFFNLLAGYLARTLGMDFICIDRLDQDLLFATTLSICCEGCYEENITYALRGTPCGEVVGRDVCSFPDNVCALFPHDRMLENLGAEAYVGVTLWSRDNRPIGLIAGISRQPLHNRSLAEAVLRHVAVRAASELERLDAEQERLRLELQLQQAQKLESLGVLAGGVAHDFNNLLSVIIGNCSLIRLRPETAGDRINMVESAATRAAALCQQMLAYAGKAAISKARVDVCWQVNEMVKLSRSSIGQNVEITCSTAADIPQIIADASQIQQVAMNMIINAAEAIGEARGTVSVGITRKTVPAEPPVRDVTGAAITPGEYVCLEVTDSGCGMDAETRQRIFEPFFTTKFTGRGLGMSAVLGIIKAHNGALQLESRPGSGSTFRVYFPVTGDGSSAGSLAPGRSTAGLFPAGKAILLVEDEEDVMAVAVMMLEELGCRVIRAANGREALDVFSWHQDEISVVLTDLGMPVMDGYSLVRELKQRAPALPIIISSGFGDMAISSRISRNDIAGIIGKPFNFEQLRNTITRALS